MRQVNRAKVDTPPNLVRDLSEAIGKIRQGQKADHKIYRHNDVLERLRTIYLDKCYLCEKEVGASGEVDHFLPWHKTYPERAYDWSNLHLACGDCNKRKKAPNYKEPSKGVTIKTLLIDPSNPPFGCTVEELIRFNKVCEAISGSKEETKEEVRKTIQFLNEVILWKERQRRWSDLEDVLFENNSFINIWRDIANNPDPIIPENWQNSIEVYQQKLFALEKGDMIYSVYLVDKAPFCSCIKYVIFEKLRVSIQDFKRMSEAYRIYKGMPLL